MSLPNARYIRSLDASQPTVVAIKTNAAVVAGDILAITSGLVGPLTAADTGIIGIAMGDADSGAFCNVMMLTRTSIIRIPYTGTTKTSLTDADCFGTAFDWDGTAKKLNLDDVTGGTLLVVAYDNTNDTADVVIKGSALWVA
jgi:hypothetical protein